MELIILVRYNCFLVFPFRFLPILTYPFHLFQLVRLLPKLFYFNQEVIRSNCKHNPNFHCLYLVVSNQHSFHTTLYFFLYLISSSFFSNLKIKWQFFVLEHVGFYNVYFPIESFWVQYFLNHLFAKTRFLFFVVVIGLQPQLEVFL